MVSEEVLAGIVFMLPSCSLFPIRMKNLKTILFVATLFVVGSVFNATAQKKAQRTSSAKAYYGYSIGKPKVAKKNKLKVRNFGHTKPAKGTRANEWATRRRYTHS